MTSSHAETAPSVAERAQKILQSVFKLETFRPGQLEAIRAVADGVDVGVRMTTSSGKSLCYQLAPLLFGQSSACIVISPLHALMIEQVQYVEYMYVIWQASIIRSIN